MLGMTGYLNLQTNSIRGTVSDANGALPGVTVTVKKALRSFDSAQDRLAQGDNPKTSDNSVITDEKGKYTIDAAEGDVLVFSYIGYKDVAVTVAVDSVVNVTMTEDATTLKEVTINAGYYTVKDKERTGSIAKITSKDLDNQPVTNVLAAMQGRMAGVSITQTSGVPGSGFDIKIRGQNSLRAEGNSPLYLIDGVPYSSESIGNSRTTSIMPTVANPLNSINPTDIESIEVLKDADATAIYGSRGANGVVLITTKKGKQGKTRFTANVSQGAAKVTKFMKLLNTEQYLAMRNEGFANDGVSPGFSDYDVNGTWDQNRYTDWQKELLGGTVSYKDANASVSGGSATTQFLVSGTFHDETTVFPGDYGYKRGVLRSNINHASENNKFRMSLSTGYTVQDNNQPAIDLSRTALQLAPNAPALYNADGSLNWEGSTWVNPLASLDGKYRTKTYDFIANSLLSYSILPGLEVKSSFGITDTKHDETRTTPSTIYDPAYEAGPEYSNLLVNTVARRSWIAEPQVSWLKQWKYGKTELLAGGTFQQQKNSRVLQSGDGFASNSLIYNLASAFSVTVSQDQQTDYKYQAFFGRFNYSYKDKYIVNLTARRDGSSRFGPGKQFATFGAVGSAWLFGEESFVKDKSILSFGKLRGSYGTTGNDLIGDYQFLDTFLSSGVSYNGVIGLQPTRLYNPNFGWETNKKLEVALEAGFFKDRIFMTVGWYSNRSSSQLVGIPMPATTGFPTLQGNLDATVQNSGTEITLRTVNFQNGNFGWTTNFNISFSKNKLLSFPNLESSTYRNQFVIGEALNIQRVYHYTGLDPQTGVYTFADMNGDGMLSPLDKQVVKDFNPSFFGGLSNQLNYKRWQLDFMLQFVKQDNYTSVVMAGLPGTMGNQPVEVLQHWQNAGDSAGSQIYSTGYNGAALDAYYNYYESDGAIGDASYVRLKNVALSYKIPEKWLFGASCKVSLEGQNLLTFTSYKGRDPEFSAYGYLPPLKIFTAGLQFTF
ncbi:SusC/RagA family TonB-linked outer membrane protein [Flavobacterium sp. UBA7682]|uniref:SusC/RagA family TonB-linked outer membrane protein n=1 Tax=Flavobacterium sp. UBA7682 TaxID=1946560 RepID=UPI0025C4281E|nr:SusC/RagA family TonB-linked outer membrane protein [Flavobacterium sp. UBA7682]